MNELFEVKKYGRPERGRFGRGHVGEGVAEARTTVGFVCRGLAAKYLAGA